MNIETREVLADCYPRGRATQAMLTHAVEVDAQRREVAVLCKRVKLDCLADGGSLDDCRTAPVTCPACLRALRGRR